MGNRRSHPIYDRARRETPPEVFREIDKIVQKAVRSGVDEDMIWTSIHDYACTQLDEKEGGLPADVAQALYGHPTYAN